MYQNYQVYGKILCFLILTYTKHVLPHEDTIWWSPDEVRIVSADGKKVALPQCTSSELQQISNKYEVCHRENIEKIEQQFGKRIEGG